MCHQSVGLAARQLEKGGISTVVIGSARDVVETVGVPRFVFTDLPLGNPVGPPYEPEQQRGVLRAALELAQSATASAPTVDVPVTWTGPADWRSTYMALDDPDELRRLGVERRARQEAAKR